MTNLEWIRSLEALELAKHVINPCDNFSCPGCPLRDRKRDRCILNSGFGQGDGSAIAWLESEHTWIE